MKWSNGNGITFDPAKYGLLHFLGYPDRNSTVKLRPSIDDLPPDEKLFEKPYLDILGVRVDNRLSWRYHVAKVIARVSKNMRCLKEISGSKWGPDLPRMLMLYKSQVQSIFSYASPVWFVNGLRANRQGMLSAKLVKDLDTIQGQCLVELSGAMRTTSRAVLRKELYIPTLSVLLHAKTIAYFAKKLDHPNYIRFRAERGVALFNWRWQLQNHPFQQLEILAKDLVESAKERLKHHHGLDVARQRWAKEPLRARAIDQMAMQAVHDQCSLEWQEYRENWGQGHAWPRPLALAEPWGPQSIRYHEFLSREESTMLLHCRTGHIGLASYLNRFCRYPTDRCPFCEAGPHTVEHLFIHCNGRDCRGRPMAERRAALYKRVEGITDLRTIFVEYPDEAATFALKTFGIPQFTKANWQKTASRKRSHAAAQDGGGDGDGGAAEPEPPEKRRKKYSLLDLGRWNYRHAPSQQAS